MILLIMLLLGSICALIAYARGFNKLSDIAPMFVIGFMFFPAGLVVAICWGVPKSDKMDCPQCAERIKRKAEVCIWCGLDLFEMRRRGGL